MRAIVFAAAMAGMALAGSSPAAAQSYSAGKIVKTIDDQTLTIVLNEAGAKWSVSGSKSDAGTPIYDVDLSNGMTAFMYLRTCDNGCTGLVMAAMFSAPDGVSAADLAARLRKFNDTHASGKGFLGEDGSPMIQWYAMTDGGITMENLKTQIDVFTAIGNEFSDALYD